MATIFTRNLSEPSAPAQASPEAASAAIRASGAAVSGALKLGSEIYEGTQQLGIERGAQEAGALRQEFTTSNEAALIQQQDILAAQKRVKDEQQKQAALLSIQGPLPADEEAVVLNRIAAGKGALATFTAEVERLQTASKAGLSPAQYTTRIAAITKAAIAKYPAYSDQIRKEFAKASGLPNPDEFASFSYVNRVFGGGGGKEQAVAAAGPSKDDIKSMAEANGKLDQDVLDAYYNDTALFARYQDTARSSKTSKLQGAAVQQALDTKLAEGSITAEENKPVFQYLARVNFQNSISTLVLKQPQLLNTYLEQIAGTAPAADQLDTANKMLQAGMKQTLDASKVVTMRQIDDYAQRGAIPFQKREEIKKLVQEEYDSTLTLFADPNAGMAMASVMKTHMKESGEKQIRLMDLNVSIMNSVAGTKFRDAWFSGDKAQREKLQRDFPDLSKLVIDAENAVIGIGATVRNTLNVAGQLKVVEDTVKDGKATPEETPQRTRLTDQAISSLAEGALDRYKKVKKPSAEDVNALGTFLSNANNGAGFPTLRANEATIRDFMSTLTDQEKPAVFQAVEKSYGKELQSRVLEWERVSKQEGWPYVVAVAPNGTFTLVAPTSNVDMAKAKTADRLKITDTVPMKSPVDSQFLLARSYFEKTILPRLIASTTVRSVVTGEQKEVSAKIAVDALNQKQYSQYMPFLPRSTAGAGRGGQGGPTVEELTAATTPTTGQQQPTTGAPLVTPTPTGKLTTEKSAISAMQSGRQDLQREIQKLEASLADTKPGSATYKQLEFDLQEANKVLKGLK